MLNASLLVLAIAKISATDIRKKVINSIVFFICFLCNMFVAKNHTWNIKVLKVVIFTDIPNYFIRIVL